RTSYKQSLACVFGRHLLQYFVAQVWIKLARLYALSHCAQLFSAIGRIVYKLLIVQQPIDLLIEFVVLHELIVVVERNRKAVGHDDTWQPPIHYFAQIRRLTTKRDNRRLPLLGKVEQSFFC